MPVKRPLRIVSEISSPDPVAESAFWEAWNAHVGYLQSLCMRWMGDADEAREALSGAMLRAWEGSRGNILEIGNLRAWLTAITKHHCIDLLRARNRTLVHVADLSALVAFADDNEISHDGDPERGFIRKEDFQAVLVQMDGLPERLRTVLEMRGCLGMEYSEIAGRLQISQGTARKRVQEARKLLKDALLFGPPQHQRPADRLPDDGGIRSLAPRSADSNAQVPVRAEAVPHHAVTVCVRGRDLVLFRSTRQHRLQQQLSTLDAYLLRHPGGWIKRLERAELWLQSGDTMSAFSEMQSVLAKQSQLFDLRVRLVGLSQQALGKVDRPLFGGDLRHLGTEDQRLLLQALSMQVAGKPAKAIETLQQALGCFPDSISCMHTYLRLLLQTGDHTLLESTCMDWIRRHPLDRAAHFFRACLPAAHPDMLSWMKDTQRKFPREVLAKLQLLRAELMLGSEAKLDRLPAGTPASLEWELRLLQAHAKGGVALMRKRFRALSGHETLAIEWERWFALGGVDPMPQPCWVHWLPEILF